MKRVIILFLTLFLVSTTVACALSSPEEAPLPQGHYKFEHCTLIIQDEVDKLTDNEEAFIVKQLTPYCEKVDCDIMIRTIAQESNSYIDYAESMFSLFPRDPNDLSSLTPVKTQNARNGIVITYNFYERTIWVKREGEDMEYWLSDTDIKEMYSAGMEYFIQTHYPKGFIATAEKGLQIIIKEQQA